MKAVSPQDKADARLLLQLAGEGNNAALDALILKFGNLMLETARRQMWNQQDAEDAVQIAWVKLWLYVNKKNGVFDDLCEPVGFVCAFAKHAAMSLLKRRWAVKRGGKSPDVFTYDVLREMYDRHRSRHRGRDHDETPTVTERAPCDDPVRQMGMVHRLVSELPPKCAAALDAFYFRGESVTALAARIGLSYDATNRILCDGIQILRHLARKAGEDEYEEVA